MYEIPYEQLAYISKNHIKFEEENRRNFVDLFSDSLSGQAKFLKFEEAVFMFIPQTQSKN